MRSFFTLADPSPVDLTPHPLVLTKPMLRLRPTRFGYLFILVLLAMLLGALNYNNNLALLMVFLLGSMGGLSILHTLNNLQGLQLTMVHVAPAFCGAEAVFHIRWEANGRERYGITWGFGAHPSVVAASGKHSGEKLALCIPTERRGYLRPDPLRIRSEYPLGLFGCEALVITGASCLVYPAPHPVPLRHIRGGRGSGGKTRNQSLMDHPEDFQGLNPYQVGDSQRRIYWQAFSRGQGLMTKAFTGTGGDMMIFDFDAIDARENEQKLARLCHMILTADRLRLSYGLTLPGKHLEPDSGERHKQACLKALALFPDG